MAYVEDLGNKRHKIYVDMGYDTRGKRKRRTKTVTVTSNRDLNKKIRAFELQCMQDEEEPIDDIGFGGFVEKWQENHVNTNLARSSADTYHNTLHKSGLFDYFKRMKLKDIRKYHIVEYISSEQKQKKAMLPEKFLVLKSIFAKAVEWEIIKDNPTKGIKQPEREKKETDYYTEIELNHLFSVLDNVYPKHRIMIKMAAVGGMRRAEIAGVREESIDYDNNSIYVDKQLRYSNGEFYMAPVKNKKPRTVFFPETFMKELKKYHTDLKRLRMELGNLWKGIYDENGDMINLLFVKENGYPAHVNSIGNEWAKIIRRYNLKPITFHQLRHSCASLMVKRGINFKVIQERLGHANIGITIDRYSHLEDEQHKKSTAVFDDIL